MDNYNSPFGASKSSEDAAIDELLSSIKAQQKKANAEKASVDDGLATLASAFFEDTEGQRQADKVAPLFDSLPPLPDNSDAVKTYSGIDPIWDDLDLTTSTEYSREEELKSFINENPFENPAPISGEAAATAAQSEDYDFSNPFGSGDVLSELETAFPPLDEVQGEAFEQPAEPASFEDTSALVYPRAAEAEQLDEPLLDNSYFSGAFSEIKGAVSSELKQFEADNHLDYTAEVSAINGAREAAAPPEETDFAAEQSAEPEMFSFEPTQPAVAKDAADALMQNDPQPDAQTTAFTYENAETTADENAVAAPLVTPTPEENNAVSELEEAFTVQPKKAYDEFSDDGPDFSNLDITNAPAAAPVVAPKAEASASAINTEVAQTTAEVPQIKQAVPSLEDNEYYAAMNSAAAPVEEDFPIGEDEPELPPYIAPRAVKRGGKKKKKGAKKSSASSKSRSKGKKVTAGGKKGRGGLIALIAVLAVIAIAAAVFFPTINFTLSLLSKDYSSAAAKYESSVASSDLQLKVANPVAGYFAEKIATSYESGELSYDEAISALTSLSTASGLADAVAEATTRIEKINVSNEAFVAGTAALDAGDLPTAVEQLSLVDEVSANYAVAQSKLATAKESLKSSILESTKSNFANGYFTAVFTEYDVADRLLPGDSDIAAQYATHENDFKTYITSLVNQHILAGEYSEAYSTITYAVNLAHKCEDLIALNNSYSPWIAPVNLFTLSSVDSNSADSGYSEADWNKASDLDHLSASFSSGKVFTVTSSNSFEKEYQIDGNYEQLTGTLTAHMNSTGVGSGSVSGRLYIYGDGSLIYSSSSVSGTTEPVSFNVDISDVDDLTFILDVDTENSIPLSLAITDFNLYKNMDDLRATLQ